MDAGTASWEHLTKRTERGHTLRIWRAGSSTQTNALLRLRKHDQSRRQNTRLCRFPPGADLRPMPSRLASAPQERLPHTPIMRAKSTTRPRCCARADGQGHPPTTASEPRSLAPGEHEALLQAQARNKVCRSRWDKSPELTRRATPGADKREPTRRANTCSTRCNGRCAVFVALDAANKGETRRKLWDWPPLLASSIAPGKASLIRRSPKPKAPCDCSGRSRDNIRMPMVGKRRPLAAVQTTRTETIPTTNGREREENIRRAKRRKLDGQRRREQQVGATPAPSSRQSSDRERARTKVPKGHRTTRTEAAWCKNPHERIRRPHRASPGGGARLAWQWDGAGGPELVARRIARQASIVTSASGAPKRAHTYNLTNDTCARGWGKGGPAAHQRKRPHKRHAPENAAPTLDRR